MTSEGRWLGTIGSAWLSGTAEDAVNAIVAAKNARCLTPAP